MQYTKLSFFGIFFTLASKLTKEMELNVHREITALAPEDCFVVYDRPVKSYDFPIHFHPDFELNLIYNCKGVKRVIGDHIGVTNEVELVLVGSNLVHGWEMHQCKDKRIHEICLQFQSDLYDEKFLSRNMFNHIKEMFEKSVHGILFSKETTLTIIPMMHELAKLNGVEAYQKLLSIMHVLASSKNQKLLSSSASYVQDFDNSFKIKRVYEFVTNNYYRKITLDEISELVNMSPVTFNRFIKKRVGKTFINYLNDTRISFAVKMLLETEMSIGEIAFNCGFNNIANFNRIFKKSKNCTPSQYRVEFKEMVQVSSNSQIK